MRKREKKDEEEAGNRPQMLSQILAPAKESILVMTDRLRQKDEHEIVPTFGEEN